MEMSHERLDIVTLGVERLEEMSSLMVLLNPELSEELLMSRMRQIFSYANYRCLGLQTTEGRLVGMAGLWETTRLYSGRQWELDHVVVDPSYRGSGVGSMLEAEICRMALEEDCQSLELNTYVRSPRAHKFYMGQGYDIIGFHMIKRLGPQS